MTRTSGRGATKVRHPLRKGARWRRWSQGDIHTGWAIRHPGASWIPVENRRREQDDTAEGHHLPAEGCATAASRACYPHAEDLVNGKGRRGQGRELHRRQGHPRDGLHCPHPRTETRRRLHADMQVGLESLWPSSSNCQSVLFVKRF